MIDLSKHQVLEDLYNLSSAIENLGDSKQVNVLSAMATDVLNKVNLLVLENEAIRRREIKKIKRKKH